MKLARDLKAANIPIADIRAIMSMPVSEVRTLKSLLENELHYTAVKAAEEKFLDRPSMSDSELKTAQAESLKIQLDRQRREDEFLYGS